MTTPPDKTEQPPEDNVEQPDDDGEGTYEFCDYDGTPARIVAPLSYVQVATPDGWMWDTSLDPMSDVTPADASEIEFKLPEGVGLEDEVQGEITTGDDEEAEGNQPEAPEPQEGE